jgi:uroporphyrinogen decarboxylase
MEANMNSRARMLMALNHQEPDRIPFDFGGTALTSIHHRSYRQLRRLLGLPDQSPRLMDIFQQIVRVDEDVRQRLRADVRNVAPNPSSTYRMELLQQSGYASFYDEWGIGWRMPLDGGWYYDMFDHPLRQAASTAEIDHYPWPDPTDPQRFSGLRQQLQYAAQVEQQAVFLPSFCSGVMEMAAWLRGFENFFADFANQPELIVYLMEKIVDLKMAYWETALQEAGDDVDVVGEADDFAGQFRTLISPAMYRRLVKPLHKKLFDFIHARTRARLFFHSCGAIRLVIPDLIEIGVDILNPVQVSASGMDSAELKREFGSALTFWGGGVDTQRVLGEGTPEQVRLDTRRRIADLAPGGGFIFAAVHNIQGNVPAENILAMWDTLQKYGLYS